MTAPQGAEAGIEVVKTGLRAQRAYKDVRDRRMGDRYAVRRMTKERAIDQLAKLANGGAFRGDVEGAASGLAQTFGVKKDVLIQEIYDRAEALQGDE